MSVASMPYDTPARLWPKGCGACRASYGKQAWDALPLAFSLPPAIVQAYLSVPAALTVEVRRCACGAMIAARG